MNFNLKPGHLSFTDLRSLLDESTKIALDESCLEAIYASEKMVADLISHNKPVYGINTGFGLLANQKIDSSALEDLQRSVVLSHACGTGDLLPDETVRLILALKINCLARGYSGVRLQIIEALIKLFNAHIYPCIPSQGSVGASGDLAPLAHLGAVLLGAGDVRYQDRILTAEEGLHIAGLEPIALAPKEGVALINGTQVSTALAIIALFKAENVFINAIIAGALSTDAIKGSDQSFDERIQIIRGHATQKTVADMLRELLNTSEIRESHRNCEKIQDPYSIRCQPQVMGACLAHLLFAADVLFVEANAVTDNPLVFAKDKVILSGGNFHAEPVAMAADTLALSIAEIGALSERRIALMMDPNFSHLPPFLVNQAGVNSGFMMAQVTAAALASENKSMAHPACVDSLPTSANQEDHVSMATFAARRLLPMIENTVGIVAIELLAACQGIDFCRPLKTSPLLENVFNVIRKQVAFYEQDRFFAPDIAAAKNIVRLGLLRDITNLKII